ncbi:hypothetical protein BGW41_008307 [Actinomortierella wolfii]|nr:hypothetical protein BGW41_008307 [Actinomortierella wolfii]
MPTRTLESLPIELIESILPHLSQSDIAQCVLVSRSWNTLLIPYLWRTLAIHSELQAALILEDEAWKALIKNAPFVGELHLSADALCDGLPHLAADTLYDRLLPPAPADMDLEPEGYAGVSSLLTNIHTLEVYECENIPPEELDERILVLIRQNHHLRNLKIHREFSEKALLDIITDHVPNLQRFNLVGSWWGDIKALLDNLPESIRYVHLDDVVYVQPNTPSINPKTSVKRHDVLQSLTMSQCLRHGEDYRMDFIVPFLESCSCNLQTLECWGLELYDPCVIEALRKIGYVWKVLPLSATWYDGRLADIVSLSNQWTDIEVYLREVRSNTIAGIIENCEHLETMQFVGPGSGSEEMTGSDLQAILSKAKFLKCLTAHWLLSNNSITAADILSSRWATSSLEHIDFKIEVPRAIGEVSEEAIRHSREIQRQVLRRLGQQKRMRKLVIGGMASTTNTPGFGIQVDCLEMTLESGLDELADLKELEELDIHHMDHRVRVPELEWMVEHLPKLRRLIGMCDSLNPYSPEVEEWLQTHRPTWLRTIEQFRASDY